MRFYLISSRKELQNDREDCALTCAHCSSGVLVTRVRPGGTCPVLFVQQITAAPGKIAQFEDVVGRINEAYKQTGAQPQNSITYSTAQGGNFRTYYFAVAFNQMSDLDSWRAIPAVVAEAFGAEEAAKILMAGDESILTQETSISFTKTTFQAVQDRRDRQYRRWRL